LIDVLKNLFLIFVILYTLWFVFYRADEVVLGPGVKAPIPPLQSKLLEMQSRSVEDYTLTDVADFFITAKVLGKENYSLGREADLSPTDLALGWRNMSDESILQKIDISQSGRFYRWRVEQFPIPRREIEMNSANMHIIPANALVEAKLATVRRGDVIKMSGTLVDVTSNKDNWRWQTSRTRNDTGAGACEIIWVDSLYIVTPS